MLNNYHTNITPAQKMVEINNEIHFYLPSAVKAVYGENKISEFTTTLPSAVRLSEAYNFEICMTKIIYPAQLNNVYDGKVLFWSYATKRMIPARIEMGIYQTPDAFIAGFKKALKEDYAYYTLTIDASSQKFELLITGVGSSTPYMKISPNIQAITGLPSTTEKPGYTISATSWDASGGNSIFYVYSDLTEYVNIGNTKAGVVGIFGWGSGTPVHNQYEYEPRNLIYTGVNKNIIDSIKINIRNKTGDLIPFVGGECLVVLHVRIRDPKV